MTGNSITLTNVDFMNSDECRLLFPFKGSPHFYYKIPYEIADKLNRNCGIYVSEGSEIDCIFNSKTYIYDIYTGLAIKLDADILYASECNSVVLYIDSDEKVHGRLVAHIMTIALK